MISFGILSRKGLGGMSVFKRHSKLNNYEFCAQWVAERVPADKTTAENFRVLDYGCGGEIVTLLHEHKIDAYGCDVFYEGGSLYHALDKKLLDESFFKAMEGNIIPFPDQYFDIVVNNQVIEHVANLDIVLAEMKRVLKPGGMVLSLFPDKGVWRENHCGIPFLHWFPKNSRPRVYYTAWLCKLGMGYFKGAANPMDWSANMCKWLDQWMHYRPWHTIAHAYRHHFNRLEYIEAEYFALRIGPDHAVAKAPRGLRRLLINKLAGRVFVAHAS